MVILASIFNTCFLFLLSRLAKKKKGLKRMDKIKAFFKINERKTTIWTELIGGLVTFLAMVYILPVNSGILADGTGMEFAAVFAATAIAAAIATLLMGLFANYPVALAPGMGINAFFTYTVVLGLGIPWDQALAAVLISGVIFLVISVTGVRRYVINAIPKNLKLAIGAGIGFFIAFIGLKNAGVVVSSPSTFVTLGDLSHPTVLLGLFGIILVFVLYSLHKKISRFAVILSIVAVAVIGLLLGAVFPSLKDLMPAYGGDNLGSVKDLKETFGKCFTAIPELLKNPSAYAVIFTFLFVDFFDTAGTLVAVGKDANLLDENGQMIGDDKAFLSDAVGTVVGSVLGTSTVTSYIESTTGIQSGARTGLSAVVVGLLFIVSLLFYPLFSVAGSIEVAPNVFYSPVTAMALVFVGAMMIGALKEIDWKDPIVVVCAFITIIMMLTAYSIAEGIAFGFIFYVLMMTVSKRHKEVSLPMYILALLFVVNFVIKFTVLQ
jgi:AGZA family xanthine/uracil permease-like MFS transporter